MHFTGMARIARFARCWGMDTYRSTAMRWPTRDGVMPVRLFFALESAMCGIAAAEQLQQYYAVALGTAQVMGGKEGRGALTEAVQSLTALAYPGASDG